MNASTYKLAKHLLRILNEHLTLNNYYIICYQFHKPSHWSNISKNKQKPQTDNIRHKRPHCQHPHRKTLTITKSILSKDNDTPIMQQIITLMRLVLLQNYFTFQNKIYQP